MNKIYLSKGLPASGKTTWANEKVSTGEGKIININKDDLRSMLHAGKGSKYREAFVIESQTALTKLALSMGHDVIWSDTNLNPIHEERARTLSDWVEIVDHFLQVTIEDCISRDKNRSNPVGEKAIRDQYNKWLRKEPEILVQDESLPKVAVFDMDGTLTLGPHNRSPYEWHKVGQDKVNEMVKHLVLTQKASARDILIVSGRDSVCRSETIQWLEDNDIPYDKLFMRAQGDGRPDDVIKEEIIDREILPNYNIKIWVDDRLKVCRMIHRKGLPLLRVGDPEANF
jgi:predicted kinase